MNKRTKHLLILILFMITFSACIKDEFIDLKEEIQSTRPNNSMLGQQCLNDQNHSPSKSSQYQTLVFSDDFGPGKTGECYTMKPKCGTRLDWFYDSDCPFDEKDSRYAGLKDLNKCVWNPWHGYNFWASNKQITFKADAIEVKDGKLIFKVLSNPDYDPKKGKCGDRDEKNPYSLNYQNQNCLLISGGIDSKFVNDKNHGFNALYGRIEMKARFTKTSQSASYPALWMWPGTIGKGFPHIPTSANLKPHANGSQEPARIGEIDILESDGADSTDYAFQSYHEWEFPQIHGYWSKGRVAHMADFHTYGVEWSPVGVKFYIDNCYTYEIKNGEITSRGKDRLPMTVSDTASFMIMSIGAGQKPIDVKNGDTFEIDEVKIFE